MPCDFTPKQRICVDYNDILKQEPECHHYPECQCVHGKLLVC